MSNAAPSPRPTREQVEAGPTKDATHEALLVAIQDTPGMPLLPWGVLHEAARRTRAELAARTPQPAEAGERDLLARDVAREWALNGPSDDPAERDRLWAALDGLVAAYSRAAPRPAVPDGENASGAATTRREPCDCGHARREHQSHEDGDGDCEIEECSCAVYEARGWE